MRLVIRQYIESLKERGELDVLLPDLLSQMGLEVFLTPGIGARQFGVDVAAVGSIDGSEKAVFLFSIKSGDLGRRDWDSGSPQDLRASINEIIDVFIPQRIPPEYKLYKIQICLCFGGEIKEEVRPNVSAFTQSATKGNISFSEWNGDKLSDLIERHFLREELLPKESRGLLRKALAMLDEPAVSFKHFSKLITLLSQDAKDQKKTLIILRQLYICTGMLYSWCREADNLESIYLASEFTLLRAWEIFKPNLGKRSTSSKNNLGAFEQIFNLYISITNYYLEKKILPNTNKLHALSNAVNSSNSVDINLKLFDTLGRLALAGVWMYWFGSREGIADDMGVQALQVVHQYREAVKNLIINNPILYNPYKDDQAIEIALALLLLSIEGKNNHNIQAILKQLSESIYYQFNLNNHYPANIYSYSDLIEHPSDDSDEYRKSVTKGSILYPIISIFSAIYGETEAYELMKKLKQDYLKHCNYQIFFLDDDSEKYLYNFEEMHGATLSHINIDQDPAKLLEDISNECQLSNSMNNLSAIKFGIWPLLLVASRHYRIPVPIHFIMELA